MSINRRNVYDASALGFLNTATDKNILARILYPCKKDDQSDEVYLSERVGGPALTSEELLYRAVSNCWVAETSGLVRIIKIDGAENVGNFSSDSYLSVITQKLVYRNGEYTSTAYTRYTGSEFTKSESGGGIL